MRLYLSGGSEIAETQAKESCVMLSYHSHTTVSGNKPKARMRAIMKLRKAAKANKKAPTHKKGK